MDELERIQQQIAELQKQAEEISLKKKQVIIDEIKAKIKAYGITGKELGFKGKGDSAKQSTPVPVKYRQGENTWSGRGRYPKFVADHLAAGGKIEDLLA